jgi:hypothetical protein
MPLVSLASPGVIFYNIIRCELSMILVQVSLDDHTYRCQEIVLGPFCSLVAFVRLFSSVCLPK